MYVHDICAIVWEILRLRRCKVVQLLKQPGQYSYERKLLRMHGSLTKRLKSRFQKYSANSSSTRLPLKRKPSGSRPQTSSCSTGC
jgi:hypothetical protein